MHNQLVIYCLVVANVLAGVFFAYDKFAAIRQKHRIPEIRLHLLEAFGGVFTMLILMYLLRHKNRKFAYWSWTWAILVVWVVAIYKLKLL